MTTTVQFIDRLSETINNAALNTQYVPVKEKRNMNDEVLEWIEEFRLLFDNKATAYKNGLQNAKIMFSREEKDFLRSIGATPQEIFDFVEDWCDAGTPDLEMALAIATIRRNYFLQEQHGYRVVA